MTIEEVAAFLSENMGNPEVQKLISKPALTVDVVTEFLDTPEGRPIKDRFINAAVIAHDEKQKPNIEKMIHEAAEKAARQGAMSESEKLAQRIAEMEERAAKSEKDAARVKREADIRRLAEAHKVSGVIVDTALSSTLELADVEAKFQAKAAEDGEREKALRNQIVNGGYKPSSPGGGPSGAVDLKRLQAIDIRDMSKMSDAQLAELTGAIAE